MDPRARLAEVQKEAKALHVKGQLSKDEVARFNELVEEGETLKAQLEVSARFAGLDEYASKSAGSLPIAGDPVPGQVTVNGMTPAGATTVGYSKAMNNGRLHTSFEILDEYGEGIQSTKQYAAISTPEYRDAIKSYVRKGERGLKASELKVLQEGIDNEGGLAA